MNRKLLNIIKESPILSRLELEQYVYGDLTDEQKYQIELKITNNPINQELLEAYIQNPNAIKGKGCILRRWFNRRIVWFFVGFSLLFISFIIFWPDFLKQQSGLEAETIAEQPINLIEEVSNEKVVKSESLEDVDVKVSNTNSLQINPKQTIKYSTVAPIPTKKVKAIKQAEISRPNLQVDRKYPAIYLDDFKVTDYGKIRKVEKTEPLMLTGRPASMMSRDSGLEYERLEEDSTFYVDFLREALRGFKHEKYRAILPAWNKILKNFPDDDNALFYRALTNFKLKQYKVSIQDLQAVLKNPMSNFDEEANWYLALNYYSINNLKDCRIILKRIIEDATFYEEKAKILIKQCK